MATQKSTSKKKLAYSALTDTVFYIDGRGKQVDIPKGNFIQMVLLWLNEGEMPEVGSVHSRTLSVNNDPHWEIAVKRIK